jgi:hypothetical protein
MRELAFNDFAEVWDHFSQPNKDQAIQGLGPDSSTVRIDDDIEHRHDHSGNTLAC